MTQQESPTENSFHNNDNNNNGHKTRKCKHKERQRQRDKDRETDRKYVQRTIARRIEFEGNKSNLKQLNPAIKKSKEGKSTI